MFANIILLNLSDSIIMSGKRVLRSSLQQKYITRAAKGALVNTLLKCNKTNGTPYGLVRDCKSAQVLIKYTIWDRANNSLIIKDSSFLYE